MLNLWFPNTIILLVTLSRVSFWSCWGSVAYSLRWVTTYITGGRWPEGNSVVIVAFLLKVCHCHPTHIPTSPHSPHFCPTHPPRNTKSFYSMTLRYIVKEGNKPLGLSSEPVFIPNVWLTVDLPVCLPTLQCLLSSLLKHMPFPFLSSLPSENSHTCLFNNLILSLSSLWLEFTIPPLHP